MHTKLDAYGMMQRTEKNMFFASFTDQAEASRSEEMIGPLGPCEATSSVEERNELSAPLLHKTINENEDVRNHLFDEQQEDSDLESLVQKRPESGILPPVIAYKTFSSSQQQVQQAGAEKSFRKSILQRSRTINVPESSQSVDHHCASSLNGSASSIHHHDQVRTFRASDICRHVLLLARCIA